MLANFTQHGLLAVESSYFAERYAGAKGRMAYWNQPYINHMIWAFQRGWFAPASYGATGIDAIAAAVRAYPVNDQHVMVIGTEYPWVEVALLMAGARCVTTLEYGRVNVTAERMEAFVPNEYADTWLSAWPNPPLMDAVVSYSSLEHSGLGRYGETLNPYGDLDASEEAYCMLKPGGLLYLEMEWGNVSEIVWNAHRVYGPERAQLFGAGWCQREWLGGQWRSHTILVLERPRAEGGGEGQAG
jgi:hypothetical protein